MEKYEEFFDWLLDKHGLIAVLRLLAKLCQKRVNEAKSKAGRKNWQCYVDSIEGIYFLPDSRGRAGTKEAGDAL